MDYVLYQHNNNTQKVNCSAFILSLFSKNGTDKEPVDAPSNSTAVAVVMAILGWILVVVAVIVAIAVVIFIRRRKQKGVMSL